MDLVKSSRLVWLWLLIEAWPIVASSQIKLFPRFTFIPKTGMGQPKTRVMNS